MAKNFEGAMQEALDAAADEAVREFDEAQSEDGEEVADDAAADEGDEEALEAADEQSDDDEPEAEDDEPADGDDDEPEVDFAWDGNPETVPEKLKPGFDKMYETMRKGVDVWMSKKAQEWNVQRQQYEARLRELETSAQESRRAALEPKLPSPPGPDATQEQIDHYYDARAKYAAYQQLKELQEAGLVASPQKASAPQANDVVVAVEKRMALVQKQDGYSDDIGISMAQMAETNPALSQLLLTDEGAVALFQMAKTQADAAAFKKAAADAKSAELKHKAGAVKRKVQKPTSAKKSVSPAHNFADKALSFEDKLDLAIAEGFQDFGA